MAYYVVKYKEAEPMFVRVVPNNKGQKKTFFCDLVESYRDDNGIPKHRTVVKLGQFDADHVPYLKAAFSKDDPAAVLKREIKKRSG